MSAQAVPMTEPWNEFMRILRRRMWTIRTFFCVTVLVVAVGTFLQTPAYKATASVLIDMETPSVLAVSTTRDDSTVAQASYMTYADYYRTQLEIIISRAIAERVFNNLKLGDLHFYSKSKDPVGLLMSQLKVEPVKQTRLVKISIEDRNPNQAARIANEVAMVFSLENLNKTSIAESMTLMKNEYMKLQSKEAELSKRYKAKHPAIIRVRTEMDQLAHSMEAQAKRQNSLQQPPAEADAGEGEAVPPSTLMDHLRESPASGSLRPNNIRVQDLAKPPLKPIRPKKVLSLLLGGILGLLGGVGVAVGQEMLDSSLKSPDDIEQDGQLVLLGHVPKIEAVRGTAGVEMQQNTQFAHIEAFSPAAEAYRSIRTTLMYAAPVGKAKAIVFTSPGPGEGKTTTVSNLGVAIAQSGVKTILVDADLRKGRLHDVFGLPRSPGLSELLTGQASFEEVVRETKVPGLWLVTCGMIPPYPAELVGSPQMQNFLQQASGKFDRILLDTPPVLAVTDAVVMAAMTKVVVVIAQSGKTPRQALHRLFGICDDVRAKVLGVILNNVPFWSVPPYYRYSSYGYAPHQSKSDSGVSF